MRNTADVNDLKTPTLADLSANVPLHRRLYFKIALAFILIFALGTATQIYLAAAGWKNLAEELDQALYWDMVEEFAARIEPSVRDTADQAQIESRLLELKQLNPKIEPYVLDSSGKIRFYLTDPTVETVSQIELSPIHAALAPISPRLPLYGSDPRNPHRKQVFVVAPLTVGGAPGYLYLILRSPLYDLLIRLTGQFYVAKTIASGIGFSFVIAIGLGLLVFRYITRNLQSLTDAVRRFGAGELLHRAPIQSKDEIGLLAENFNRMAETVLESTNRLRLTDEQRRLFIASVTHDLRTPLTVMRGYVELLDAGNRPASEQERKQYLTMLEQGIHSSIALVDDLFELSRLEAKERTPSLEPVALAELVSSAVEGFRPAAQRRSIDLRFAADQCRAEVLADAVLLLRVLQNLISNSLKYSPEGGVVTISVREQESGVEISVEDCGKGIPLEEQRKVFDSFYRVAPNSSDDPGTGLGLSIVKKILELHGSAIEVHSVPGRGTIFSFSMPRFQSTAS